MTRSFRTSFDLDAPLDVAWQAFTTPELIETWLGPVDECDIRPGGLIRFRVPGLDELTWRAARHRHARRAVTRREVTTTGRSIP